MQTQPHDRTPAARATCIALVLVVAFLLFVMYGLIDNRWYHIVTINGGSMEPAIRHGDAIVIVRPPEVLKPGMIVTLQVGENVVTHRIKTVAPDGTFTTAGDANPTSDDFTGTSVKVVGVCVLRIPLLGRLLNGMSDAARSAAYYASRRVTGASVTAAEGTLPSVFIGEGASAQLPEPPPAEGSTDAPGPDTEVDESADPPPHGQPEESADETPAVQP